MTPAVRGIRGAILEGPDGNPVEVELPGAYVTTCPRCREMLRDCTPPEGLDARLARQRYFNCGACGWAAWLLASALGHSDAP